MIFRRLMMLPRFAFAKQAVAVQSVEGSALLMQATNRQHSPIPPPADTLDRSSAQPPKVRHCSLSSRTLPTSATSLRSPLNSEKSSRIPQLEEASKEKFSHHSHPKATTKSPLTSSTPSSRPEGTSHITKTR